jgi:dTDP-4-dehydrorhamnose reductase
MKILVIGARGMLGSDLLIALKKKFEVIGKDIDDFDITDKKEAQKAIVSINSPVIINLAAYTDVDGCESNENLAFSVNAEGIKNIAESCREIGAKLIHISTDYVFDGKKKEPYAEDDQTNPLNVYGRSKLKGEEYIKEILADFLIIRTQWLYGQGGKNFVDTVSKLAKEKGELRVVDDQIGSPTFTRDLSEAVVFLLESFGKGTYHVANQGYCSWCQFAAEILKLSKIGNVKLVPVSSKEFIRPAPRPLFTRFNCRKFERLTGSTMRLWSEALADYLGKKGQPEN